jgi:hypothetical protein
VCCGACVDRPRRRPNEDASGANLLARAMLTERRVVKGGWYASITFPSQAVEFATTRMDSRAAAQIP